MTMTSLKLPHRPTDFLHRHSSLGPLMPTLERMIEIQSHCQAILPPMFSACVVMSYTKEQLTLGAPSNALAAKLRQFSQTLQHALLVKNIQIQRVHIKVTIDTSPLERTGILQKNIALPASGVQAFALLENALRETPQNAALKTALKGLIARY